MRLSRRPTILPQLDDVIELLTGAGTILMEIDEELNRIVELLEEDQ